MTPVVWPAAWLCEALVSRTGILYLADAATKPAHLPAMRLWTPRSRRFSCRVPGPAARDVSGTTCWPRRDVWPASDGSAGAAQAALGASRCQRVFAANGLTESAQSQIEASAPNRKWVVDSCISGPARADCMRWVVDLLSRRVVGWPMRVTRNWGSDGNGHLADLFRF
ncbi:MAG: hypothetical protein K0S45_3047 [Nitrospira sp.]|jgi:hypothetical protein|nr:hypothetical protein [Nitrospira sp.]